MAERERTVLIAMDGSDHADNAFKWFIDNGFRPEDRVVVVYCAELHNVKNYAVTIMSVEPSLISNLVAKEEVHVKEITKKFQDLVNKHKINGKVVRVHGEAGPGIVDIAKRENASFIVVGRRGVGKIRRTILGSVSEYVLHHSHVPVIVCKH